MRRAHRNLILCLLGTTALFASALSGGDGQMPRIVPGERQVRAPRRFPLPQSAPANPRYQPQPVPRPQHQDAPGDYWAAVRARNRGTARTTSARSPVNTRQHGVRTANYQQPTNTELPVLQRVPRAVPASPRSSRPMRIPLAGTQPSDGLKVERVGKDGERVSLSVRSQPLSSVLSLIAQQHDLNIVTGGSVDIPISVTLTNVPLYDALDALLRVNGFRWTRRKRIIYVSQDSTEENPIAADVQGRRLQVFALDFVAAKDVEKVVQGILSPGGKAFIVESSPLDKRRTTESIAVEDVPEVLRQVESYLAQIDHPPRQVLIEAQVLQINLTDDNQHGINFNNLLRMSSPNVTLRTVGLANAAASPAFLLGLDSSDLSAVVEALQNTSDAKTLASPKVLAVNGQQARIQIGSQLGYFVTTTTQTSTLQNVEFLDVGVVLNVTPTISQDGQILMTVKPEVSNGRINPATGLPEEDTTEVETTVLLQDGKGMVIGGLIQEADRDGQNKIPLFGDLWGVGRLFQRKNINRSRAEIIVALLPRIVPYNCEYQAHEQVELEKVHTPLLQNGLVPFDRSHLEPTMPDAYRNPRRFSMDRFGEFVPNLSEDRLHEPHHYFPTPSDLRPFAGSYGHTPAYSTPQPSMPLIEPGATYAPSDQPEPLIVPGPSPAPIITPRPQPEPDSTFGEVPPNAQ